MEINEKYEDKLNKLFNDWLKSPTRIPAFPSKETPL